MMTYTKTEEKQQATAADIEDAIAYIRHSLFFQLERHQLFVDAAVLAVEQVQDIRIEMLEKESKKEEITIYDIFFDLVLTYCWQARLAEPLIKLVAKGIITQLLKRRAVYHSLPKTDYGAQLFGMARREGDSKKVMDQIVKEHVTNQKRFTSDEFAMFSSEVRDFVKNAPDTISKEVVKLPDELKKLNKPKPLSFTNSPSISVLNAAQTYMRNHRLALNVQQTEIIKLLRKIQFEKPPITKKELSQFLTLFKWEEFKDSTEVREKYQLVFEAVIWSQLYHWVYRKHYFSNKDTLEGVPDVLRDYFLVRFRPLMLHDTERIGHF
ncbi:hypothetical protein SAMN05877753_101317 [Bacillus oleivorans]|uniref:Uncharacterized protein n=1 Tax=Bacillus oleivorans TaxID=1448271 RepID=A0A285CJ39_9BACI|nr:hypothetical protein [Bacillus oleivorans]SNX67003.1 hypothetical protein SAMN05877753_101317 [Bacillus oleivorans]